MALNSAALVTWRCAYAYTAHPATSYTVINLAAGGGAPIVVSGAPPICYAVVPGLSNGAPVTFAVTAQNDLGVSVQSAATAPVTPLVTLSLIVPPVAPQAQCSMVRLPLLLLRARLAAVT